MSAYIILEIDVHDPQTYEAYKKLSPPTIEKYGGCYLVRGGNPELVEGTGEPKRVVVLKFSDREKAQAWLHSPEYAPAWEMRRKAATSRAILVDGVE